MIYMSPYDTTVGGNIILDDIIAAVARSMAIDKTVYREGKSYDLKPSSDTELVILTGSSSSEDAIPFFAHPIISCSDCNKEYSRSSLTSLGDKNIIVADFRAFVRRQGIENNSLVKAVSSYADFDFYTRRTVLSLAWVDKMMSDLRHQFSFAGLVYGSVISEAIARRFSLDPRDQLIVFIICHLFYQSLFTENEKITDNLKHGFALHTIKATRASSDMVYEVMDRCTEMTSIADLCTNIVMITDNVKLKSLNPGLLITLLTSIWYGYGASENIAIALEHPPTWIAMVVTAMATNSFKRTAIATNADRNKRKANMPDPTEAYLNLFGKIIVEK